MAFVVQHLHSAYVVDQAVSAEQSKVVCLRLGQDFSPECMKVDELLARATSTVEGVCCIYAVDITEVPELISEFQLQGPMALAFFYKGRKLHLDLGFGAQQTFSREFESLQEFLDLVEAVYRGALQGRELITAPKDYSVHFGY